MIIPPPILADIVARVSDGGVDELVNIIKASRELADAVRSPEVYSRVRLDKRPDFPWFSHPTSSHFKFFNKCLIHNNPYALYVESLRLAFNVGDVDNALSILAGIGLHSPHAELMYIILKWCTGDLFTPEFKGFKARFSYPTARAIGEMLPDHVNAVIPRNQDSLAKTWKQMIPECWWAHRRYGTRDNELCEQCFFFYLSIHLKMMS